MCWPYPLALGWHHVAEWDGGCTGTWNNPTFSSAWDTLDLSQDRSVRGKAAGCVEENGRTEEFCSAPALSASGA